MPRKKGCFSLSPSLGLHVLPKFNLTLIIEPFPFHVGCIWRLQQTLQDPLKERLSSHSLGPHAARAHVASCCVFAKLYRFVVSFSSLLSLANTRCCMQPPRRHFLFLSTKSSGPSRCAACCMLPLSSRVLGPLSGLSSVSCPAACCNCFAFRACPCIRQAASPGSAHCFDSFCQIYIKFITTHVSQGMLHPAAQHFHGENVN